jgi:hypothetical protein
MLEGDYRAVLKALCADRLPTEFRNPADVASLLEFGTPAVHPVAPRMPDPPPRWDARLRLMDFDLPGVSRRPVPAPEHE